jgi:hypothetical protein
MPNARLITRTDGVTAAAISYEKLSMRTERLEGHDEATKALALAVVGLMAIMLISNLIVLLFY